MRGTVRFGLPFFGHVAHPSRRAAAYRHHISIEQHKHYGESTSALRKNIALQTVRYGSGKKSGGQEWAERLRSILLVVRDFYSTDVVDLVTISQDSIPENTHAVAECNDPRSEADQERFARQAFFARVISGSFCSIRCVCLGSTKCSVCHCEAPKVGQVQRAAGQGERGSGQ